MEHKENLSLTKNIVFHALAILCVVMNISSLQIGGMSHIIPSLDVIIIFYFAVFREEFSVWFLFLLGIWNDALSGNPLGTTAICYIFLVKIFNILNKKLVISDEFRQILQQFIIFISLFFVLKLLILSAFNANDYDTKIVIIQIIISSLTYIVVHKLFSFFIARNSGYL